MHATIIINKKNIIIIIIMKPAKTDDNALA